MKVLDLFSGIGGFSLGLEFVGMETIAFCEIEPFCQRVLHKHWPTVPCASDITKLTYKEGVLYDDQQPIYKGEIDLICGGFPCQPFSIAGKKKGTEDNRDIWPEMFRIIQEVKPTWVLGENVANFINMAFSRTAADLESENYEVQAFTIPACAVQAPHRRDRVWIVANTESVRHERFSQGQQCTDHQQQSGSHQSKDWHEIWCKATSDSLYSTFANTNGKRRNSRLGDREKRQILHDQDGAAKEDKPERERWVSGARQTSEAVADNRGERIQREWQKSFCGKRAFSWCENVRRVEDYFNRPGLPQPLICGDSDGVSRKLDTVARGGIVSHPDRQAKLTKRKKTVLRKARTKAIGNSVVPQVVAEIGKGILESENT